MVQEVTGRAGRNRRQKGEQRDKGRPLDTACCPSSIGISQQHQSPKSLSSSLGFQLSHPPTPRLSRIGRGSFSAVHTKEEQHFGHSARLLERERGVDGGEFPNRR